MSNDVVDPQSYAVEGWLGELGLQPVESAESEGVASWDLILDGRRRFGVPFTVILDPSIGAVVWVQYAPPLADSLRKVYRQLLRWNDELPFVKFAVGEDDQPVLSDEVAAAEPDARFARPDGGPLAGCLRPAVRRVVAVGRPHRQA